MPIQEKKINVQQLEDTSVQDILIFTLYVKAKLRLFYIYTFSQKTTSTFLSK